MPHRVAAGLALVAALSSFAGFGGATPAFAQESAEEEPAGVETPRGETPGKVFRIELDSIIHTGAVDFVREALVRADAADAAALVIELDTPGGVLEATREIFEDMLSSKTPVVIWVAPSGARAASAGFFLLMAADIAAMAPGTNTGAAHPVGGQGEDIEGHMGRKVEEDSAATIRSLAARNGRNQELAEAAVLESRSFTAEEALENELIDLVVSDLPTLLAEIDGRELVSDDGEPRVLRTAGAAVETIEMTFFQEALSILAHPNVAYLLLSLGFLGIYFELSNPGAILPGVVGVMCLLLAFLALSVLPVNYAGVALIFLAIVLFVAEVKVTSYGLLAVAGVVSLGLGAFFLFRSVDPALRVSLDVILSSTVFTAVVVGFLMVMAVRAHRLQVRTGSEGLIHERGTARSALTPRGRVNVHGEIWHAVAAEPVAAGTPIEVVEVDGMTLKVRPLPDLSGVSAPEEVA